MARNHHKVAMIGVDAAEISYLAEHLTELPNFRRLIGGDKVTTLFSDADLLPGSVWPSFYTEKTAGEHGFYLIMAWDPAAMRLRRVTPDWLPLEPFWRELSRNDVRVVTVDVPMTHPPFSGGGVEIVGWGSHQGLTSFAVHPMALAAEVRRRFGDHSLGPEIPVNKGRALRAQSERARIKSRLVESAKRKAELIIWLATSQNWDLLISVFGEAHRGGHTLWPSDSAAGGAALLEVYRAVDDALGNLIACLEEKAATIVVFALHGMGENNSQRHFVPQIVSSINDHWARSCIKTDRSAPSASRQLRLLSRLRQGLPDRTKTAIVKFIPRSAKDRVINRLYTAGHDWRTTPAIGLKSDGNGYIRLNLRGRERDGLVEPDSLSLKNYLTHLKNGVFSFATPSGRPLAAAIHLTKESTPGDRTAYLPDVVITWNDQPTLLDTITSPRYGNIFAQPDAWRGGYHRGRGFLAVVSNGARNLNLPESMSVTRVPSMIRGLLFGC